MKSLAVGLLLFFSLAIGPGLAGAEFYQWVDARGVTHFTDSYDRVPSDLRGSARLIIRTDLPAIAAPDNTSSGTGIAEVEAEVNQAPEQKPEAKKEPEKSVREERPVSIHYNPQQFTIIVVQPVVIHRGKRKDLEPGRFTAGQVSTDRRHIHPSVFNRDSRQFVHPSTFHVAPKR